MVENLPRKYCVLLDVCSAIPSSGIPKSNLFVESKKIWSYYNDSTFKICFIVTGIGYSIPPDSIIRDAYCNFSGNKFPVFSRRFNPKEGYSLSIRKQLLTEISFKSIRICKFLPVKIQNTTRASETI
jgi:hypothetical protein